MATQSFMVKAGPSSDYLFKVVVHDTPASLHKAYGGECRAFYQQDLYSQDILGDLHFYIKDAAPEIVSHEAVHAQLHHAKVIRMTLGEPQGEEWVAECVDFVVEQIRKKLRKLSIKSPKKK